MIGERQVQKDALFYQSSLERHVPETHLLRAIDRFVDLDGVRVHLAPFYSDPGRPSIELCSLKPRCSPSAPARKLLRSIHEGARDLARDIAKTEAYQSSRCERKKVEMLFAHLKRILKLDRLRLRGPCGARDEFHLAAIAQNLRKLAKLIPRPQAIPAT
jgi:hypothetical protein